MKLFSERTGLRPLRMLAADSLEPGLRNRLWNLLRSCYMSSAVWSPELDEFVRRLWDQYFKLPLDSISYATALQTIRDHFFEAKWYEVYDFIEFCAGFYPNHALNARFIAQANAVLEQECTPFRLVGGRIVQITAEHEIGAIEAALKSSQSLGEVYEHLNRAIELLADRRVFDYSGSIRQSLEAIEALDRLFEGNARGFLQQAACEIEASFALSPGFGRLFAGHATEAASNPPKRSEAAPADWPRFDEAKFMLVVSSAVVNYVVSKAAQGSFELARSHGAGR